MRLLPVGRSMVSWIPPLVLLVFLISCSDDFTDPVGPSGPEVGPLADRRAGEEERDKEKGEAEDEGEAGERGGRRYPVTPGTCESDPMGLEDANELCSDSGSGGGDGDGLNTDTFEGDDGDLPAQCDNPTNPLEMAFCMRNALTSARRQGVETALDSIETRGAVCAELADSVRINLATGSFFSFPNTVDSIAGYGQPGPTFGDGQQWPHGVIGVKERYVDNPNDSVPFEWGVTGPNVLEFIVAHEGDHRATGWSHDDDPSKPSAFTPNSEQCGNVTIP